MALSADDAAAEAAQMRERTAKLEEEVQSRMKQLMELEAENQRLRDESARAHDEQSAARADASSRVGGRDDVRHAGLGAADGGGAAATSRDGGDGGERRERNPRRESFSFPSSSGGNVPSLVRLAESSPKFPAASSSDGKLSWFRRIRVHLEQQGLGRVLDPRAPRIPINSRDRVAEDPRYSQDDVADHLRAFSILQSAVVGAPFEPRVQACTSFHSAWTMIGDHLLPRSEAETYLLKARLDKVANHKGEDPQAFFARIDSILVMLSAVDIVVPEKDVVRTIVRQLSEDYDVEKRSTLAAPDLSRSDVERVVRDSYARRKAAELRAPGGSARAPSTSNAQGNPHALAFGMGGGGRQDGRVGFGGQPGYGGGGVGAGRQARGPPSSQQQGYGSSQQWSRGGGASHQQQQQQRAGGPSQPHPPWEQSAFTAAYTDWRRMYAAWEHKHREWLQPQQQRSRPPDPHGPPASARRSAFPPPPPPPPQPPNSHVLPPRNASGEFTRGVGGVYDCGRNAEYFQTESPPPPGKPMGWVYHCQRCGRLGHEAKDCDAVRRFEGYCDVCGEYGHSAGRCHLRRRKSGRSSGGGYPHANVVSAPAAGPVAAPVASSGGVVDNAGYFTPDPAGDAGYTTMHYGIGGGEEEFLDPCVGAGQASTAQPGNERRVTYEDGPTNDGVYEVDDWNADVEAQNRGDDVFGERFAAAVSLPFGAAAGDDGEIFHSGFMALQPALAGATERRAGGFTSGRDVPSPAAATAGAVPVLSDDSASCAEDNMSPTDGVTASEPGGIETGDRNIGSGGRHEPPPLPPELELVPLLVHASPGEKLPAGATLFKGGVYLAETRQTRSHVRKTDGDATTEYRTPRAMGLIGDALAMRFASPPAAPPPDGPRARTQGLYRSLV